MGKPSVKKAARETLLLDHDGHIAAARERANTLARDHPRSAIALRLAGDLHFAAAVRARRFAADAAGTGPDGGSAEEEQAAAHLRSTRDALSAARLLVPDCVDVATALGDALAESSLYREAEAEYRAALAIPLPVDPARHNAAYGLYGIEPSTVNERVLEARDKAQRALGRLTNKLVAAEVQQVLDVAEREGAPAALPAAKRVAQRFPGSARAQLLEGYMDLKFVRGLDAAIDKRACLRRPLRFADRAAQAFPNSVVIAAFRAKLLFVLGELDAAESECRRALTLKNPNDPEEDCIPPAPGSISGPNAGARLVSFSGVFHELALKILGSAEDYWEKSMTSQMQNDFMWVRLDTLQEEYRNVDQSPASSISGAQSFFKEHKSWMFWVCPFCNGKKYVDPGSLMDHMCSKHPRAVLPRLQSILDRKLTLEGDDSFDGVAFCQDSDQHDIIRFKKRNDIFQWLFSGPNSGIVPKPFAEMREEKCRTGTFLLELIKNKMMTLPTDKSSTEFAKVLSEIQEKWLNFVKRSVLDYREVILTLARSFLWRELKKCMSEDPKVAAKRISSADIDAVFATNEPGFSAVEEQALEKDHKPSHSNQALKINGNHQESKVDAEDKSSGAMANTKLADSPINMAENGNKQGSSSQSSEETASMSIYRKSLDVVNQDTNDIFLLNFIIQILWNLRRLRDEFLKRQPVCSQPSHEGPCIADILYKVFSALEKNDHHMTSYSLISLRDTICQILNDSNVFQNVERNISSDIVATILKGLHMPEVFVQGVVSGKFTSDGIIERHEVNPAMVIFDKQMCCGCRTCFSKKEYITSGDQLVLGLLETAKVNFFAEDKCTPQFSTMVWHWPTENQGPLCEFLDGVTSGPYMEFRCKFPNSATDYTAKSTIVAMICYHQGLVGMARDQNKWLIFREDMVMEVDSLEGLLNHFGDNDIRPEVFFFEVIK